MESIARFVADAPEATRATVALLSRLAREAAPGLEVRHDGVKLAFCHRGRLVIGLFTLRSHVTLGFFAADGLPDPARLLAGQGGVRHARFHARSQLDEGKLRALLQAAARLAAS